MSTYEVKQNKLV